MEQRLKLGARTNCSYNTSEGEKLGQLLEAAKETLKVEGVKLIQEAGSLPVLVSYSNDSTPLKAVETLGYKTLAGTRRTRGGRLVVDVLVQVQFVRYLDAAGDARSVAVLRDGVPLKYGKTADAIFGVSKAFCMLPREHGARGIAISHFCFDGALFSSLSRRFHQWQLERAISRKQAELDAGRNPKTQYLKEWGIATQCVAHGAHNSLKWGIGQVLPLEPTLDDAWQVFASLKNGSVLMHRHLAQFVVEHVRPVPRYQLPDPVEASVLWNVFGMPPDLLEQVATRWQLLWDGDRFLVAEDEVSDPDSDFHDELISCIVSCLAIGGFSDSRWLTVGTSARQLMLSLMLGLPALVAFVLSKNTSEYHLAGFRKLQEGVTKDFLLICSLAAYPADVVLEQVLEDSRAGLHAGYWRQLALDEVGWLQDMKAPVWQAMVSRGLSSGLSPRVLQGQVLHAASTCVAFMDQQIFMPAVQLPWSLGQGDVDANLRRLRIAPRPEEPVSRKVQELLNEGCNLAELKAGIRLLMECPWATSTVEQQHASLQLVHRQHPDYHMQTLLLRAGLHTLRRLLPTKSREEVLLESLTRKFQQCLQSKGKAVTGRMMYLKEWAKLLVNKREKEGRPVPLGSLQSIMKLHGKNWLKKTAAQQAFFEEQAQEFSASKAMAREELERELLRDIRIARERIREQEWAACHQPLELSSCRLMPRALQFMQAAYDVLGTHPKDLQAKRQAALSCPPPLDEDEAQSLDELPAPAGPEEPMRPDWLQPVTHLRHMLSGAALRFTSEDSSTWVMVLFCKQQPQQAHLLLLTPCDPDEFLLNKHYDNWQEKWLDTFQHVFTWQPMELRRWQDFAEFNMGQVSVVRPVQLMAGGWAMSDHDLVPLQRFIRDADFSDLPEQANKKASQSSTSRAPLTGHHNIFKKHPGLKKYTKENAEPEEKEPAAKRAKAGEDEEQDRGSGPDTDEDLQEMMDEAERTREDVEEPIEPMKLRSFKTARRAWGDAWQGQVTRDSEAALWCRTTGLQQTLQAPIALGEKVATVLVEAWATKMEFLFQAHLEGLLATPSVTDETMRSYQEPQEFTDLMEECQGKTRAIGLFIRKMMPR